MSTSTASKIFLLGLVVVISAIFFQMTNLQPCFQPLQLNDLGRSTTSEPHNGHAPIEFPDPSVAPVFPAPRVPLPFFPVDRRPLLPDC